MNANEKQLSNRYQTYSGTNTNIKIYSYVPLKDKNWFQTGGPARYYCQPETNKEFQAAVEFTNKNNLKIFVLGEGANILISDLGFDGLVIHPKSNKTTHTNNNENILVTAEAGTSVDKLIEYCLQNNISGLEDFSCIPGSIGGAVFINMHYFDKFIGNYIVKATVIEKETGKIKVVDKDWFNFGYDKSNLSDGKHFLINATFELKKIEDLECAYQKGKRDEIVRYRTRQYPTSHTCGCFFRNFHKDEVSLEIDNKKMIYVAYYLDKIGIKGNLTIGDATVSYKHANMLVNKGNATTTDIIALSRTIQELAKKEYGVIPQPECLLIGFEKYPLM